MHRRLAKEFGQNGKIETFTKVAPTNFNDSRPLLGLNETEKVDYGQDPEARFKK